MPKSLKDLKRNLSQVKPWAAVAAGLTVALLAYYGFEGMRYWKAANETESLNTQRVVLARTLTEKLRGQEVLTTELDTERREMERLQQLFYHPETDYLIQTVTDVARRHRITPSSISVGEQGILLQNGVQYQTQPMTLIVEGQTADIYAFFWSLHQALPVININTVRIAGGGSLPASANVQLSLALSPHVLDEEEIAKSKSSGAKSSKSSSTNKSSGSEGSK